MERIVRVAAAAAEPLWRVWDGWGDVWTMARLLRDGGELRNTSNEWLSFWDGLSWGWVEEHRLRPLREIDRDLNRLFGSGAPSVSTDSDSGKPTGFGLRNANVGAFSHPFVTYNHDYITGDRKSTRLNSSHT